MFGQGPRGAGLARHAPEAIRRRQRHEVGPHVRQRVLPCGADPPGARGASGQY